MRSIKVTHYAIQKLIHGTFYYILAPSKMSNVRNRSRLLSLCDDRILLSIKITNKAFSVSEILVKNYFVDLFSKIFILRYYYLEVGFIPV